jgi:hypothetical protein
MCREYVNGGTAFIFPSKQQATATKAEVAGSTPIQHNTLLLTVVCGNTGQVTSSDGRRELAEMVNEFAAVRVSLDVNGNGPRLLVEDLESGKHIFLCPLELASFTLASPEDREDWLRVGNYRGERRPRGQS